MEDSFFSIDSLGKREQRHYHYEGIGNPYFIGKEAKKHLSAFSKFFDKKHESNHY